MSFEVFFSTALTDSSDVAKDCGAVVAANDGPVLSTSVAPFQ